MVKRTNLISLLCALLVLILAAGGFAASKVLAAHRNHERTWATYTSISRNYQEAKEDLDQARTKAEFLHEHCSLLTQNAQLCTTLGEELTKNTPSFTLPELKKNSSDASLKKAAASINQAIGDVKEMTNSLNESCKAVEKDAQKNIEAVFQSAYSQLTQIIENLTSMVNIAQEKIPSVGTIPLANQLISQAQEFSSSLKKKWDESSLEEKIDLNSHISSLTEKLSESFEAISNAVSEFDNQQAQADTPQYENVPATQIYNPPATYQEPVPSQENYAPVQEQPVAPVENEPSAPTEGREANQGGEETLQGN